MLNIAALRQQRIPLAVEPRAQVPFHILIPPLARPATSPVATAIVRRRCGRLRPSFF